MGLPREMPPPARKKSRLSLYHSLERVRSKRTLIWRSARVRAGAGPYASGGRRGLQLATSSSRQSRLVRVHFSKLKSKKNYENINALHSHKTCCAACLS